MSRRSSRWIWLLSVATVVSVAIALGSSAAGRSGPTAGHAMAAKKEKWVGAGLSGLDQHRHRDTGGDPKTRIVLDDDQAYHASVSFKFTIDPSGSIQGTGSGEYNKATWHLAGTNGDKGSFNCDPAITANEFTVRVSGRRTNGVIDLKLSYPDAEESNGDTPCGADFTAFGGSTTRLDESLIYMGARSLKFTPSKITINLDRPQDRSGGEYTTWTVDHYLGLTIAPDQLFSKEDKDKLARSSQDLNIAAAYWAALYVKCPECIFPGLGSAGYWLLGSINGHLALDPPNSRFRRIAKPHPPRFPKVRAQGSLNQPGADAINALYASEAKIAGYGDALVTALERSAGAKIAESATWRARQLRAARRYAGVLATAMDAHIRLLPQARSALEGSGFRDIPVVAADARAFQQQTRASGLPSWLSDNLRSLRVSTAVRNQIRGAVLAIDPNDVGRLGSFPAMLTNAQMLASLRNTAAVLRRFSRRG